MTANTTAKNPPIVGRAMLVNVHIGIWQARKHDKKVTRTVNESIARNATAGRYHKRLFGGVITSHSALVTAGQNARRTHYANTLPWGDDGWRLLPTTNYFEYTKILRKIIEDFEGMRDRFLQDYERLVEEARESLNGMYNPDDYPAAHEVHDKFHIEIQFAPLPVTDDFRLSLPKDEMDNIAKGMKDRAAEAMQEAVKDAWTRLGDAVSDLRPRLEDGKHMRSTMIKRVSDVAEVLGRLNITNDPALEKTRKQVLRDLATLDIDNLRDDENIRKDAAKKADDILKSMKSVYTPAS